MRTSSMPIANIKIGTRHRRDLGDIAGFAARIANLGALLHPIVVTPDGTLIAGERRLEACKRLGWTEIPVHVVSLDEIVRGEWAENADRKDFLPSEIEAIRRAMEPIEKAAAEQRMKAGTARDAGEGTDLVCNPPRPLRNFRRGRGDRHPSGDNPSACAQRLGANYRTRSMASRSARLNSRRSTGPRSSASNR